MLLGWVCIGCREAVEAKTPEWAVKPIPPERCDVCNGNVFQRVERVTAAEGLYPDRKPEAQEIPPSFWENEGGYCQPSYGTGADQDCDITVWQVYIPTAKSSEKADLDGMNIATYTRYTISEIKK